MDGTWMHEVWWSDGSSPRRGPRFRLLVDAVRYVESNQTRGSFSIRQPDGTWFSPDGTPHHIVSPNPIAAEDNRRDAVRFNVASNMQILWWGSPSGARRSPLLDISETGLRFSTQEFLEPGAMIRGVLPYPHPTAVSFVGEAVHSVDRTGDLHIGLRFHEMNGANAVASVALAR